MPDSGECRICRIVRLYLLLAVPLVAILGMGSISAGESGMKIWFARVELIDYLAWGSLGALFLIVFYRGYIEYWAPKRRKAKLEQLLTDDDY